jgi:UDP-3-O-[3-hydroxymyristoyl] glucosamine N-acyltransferase
VSIPAPGSDRKGLDSVPSQLGRVILEDDVEVGANTTIDPGASRDTVIGLAPVSITLCRLATMLSSAGVASSLVGISGSTVLEDFVRVGGQAERQSEFQRTRGCIAIQSSLDLIY